MTVYVVLVEAMYLHDVYGPFFRLEDAIEFAEARVSEEVDDHHDITVRSLSEAGIYSGDPMFVARGPVKRRSRLGERLPLGLRADLKVKETS